MRSRRQSSATISAPTASWPTKLTQPSRSVRVAGFGCGDANELRYHWNNGQYAWNSGLVLPDNQWALTVLVVRSTGATMYLRTASGLQTAVQPATTLGIEEFDGPLTIGTEYAGSSRYFKGNIDDVRIYKAALSQVAVEALWNDSQNPPPQGECGRLRFAPPAYYRRRSA